MDNIIGISDQTREALIITNLIAAMVLLLMQAIPQVLIVRRNWNWILGALKGADGFIDIHELRIAIGYLTLVVFINLLVFMTITYGALGWKYPDMLYFYVFMGSLGANATIIAGMWEKIQANKTQP